MGRQEARRQRRDRRARGARAECPVQAQLRRREPFDVERRHALEATAAAYREAMRGFAAMRNLDVWYARVDVEAARSGDRVAIAAYLGRGNTFDRAIAEFAERYADQNERDYAALLEAGQRGDIEIERGL